MSNLTRRRFLRHSMVVAGGTALAGKVAAARAQEAAQGRPLGANERIRVAVAGINGRGGSHIDAFAGMKDVEVAYLVDPDSRLFDSRTKQALGQYEKAKKQGLKPPTCVQDIRKALEDKDLDAVSIATPNHWHALLTIWACQAGKDVYVEKPMSHNTHEGRIAVETARKHNCIVQHGTQRRSERGWAHIIAAIRSGKLGKLLVARGFCYKAGGGGSTRGDIGFKPPMPPPSELDWNLWLGPAPAQHYHENLVHYRWHWFWDTGNGDLGNQGVHEMDVARWSIAGATLPRSVISFGGRIGHIDQGETASSQVAIMDFGETQLIFEERGLKSSNYRGVGVGNIFELEAGTIINKEFYPKGRNEPAELPDVEVTLGPGDGHFGNFVAAMRSRRTSDLNAEILEGHYSSALCHLANASLRVGGKIPFQPRTSDFDDQKEALDALERMEKYLAEENGVALDKWGYHMGRKLIVDARSERVLQDDEANAILHGFYRKPFTVPEKV